MSASVGVSIVASLVMAIWLGIQWLVRQELEEEKNWWDDQKMR